METIQLTIDNKQVEVAKGTNLVEAAAAAGIKIPTLCYMNLHELGYENKPGACRICVVEVEGRKNLAPACKTTCTQGMVVRTHTPRVINARRTVMELILSNHPNECLTCTKNGHCELQRVAGELGIREVRYRGETTRYPKDMSVSIVRDMDKCIMCRRCETACNEIQSVGVLSAVNRGFPAVVSTAFNDPIQTTACINCGQCVAVCPTGALSENSHIADVLRAIADPSKTVVVQTAPAVRVGLGQDFGYSGRSVTGKMVAALRRLGFDYVFDTDFAADLTIMEEGTELLGRLNAALEGNPDVKLPLMTSCCPGWVSFMEKHFPELAGNLSTAKSPQQMFGAVAKNYFAQQLGIDRRKLVVVSVMPCVAKKAEAARPEFGREGDPDVNIAITTRELAHLIRFANLDFASLEEEDFDRPLGESTGAAVIFGATGGVIEAAVRTAYEVRTQKPLARGDFTELRGMEGIRSATVDFDGTPIKIGIAHGLANARQLIDDVVKGTSPYHAIEIMACPGGCIGGGGQPYHRGDIGLLRERTESLYAEDGEKPLRKSHENPYVLSLYRDFLGKPCGHRAHELLHTRYYDRKPVVTPCSTTKK
jgi:NADP-reducing hydrogenase subunit HndD